MSAFKPKELKKGGKPEQKVGTCDIVLEENKAFLKQLFAGEAAAPLMGSRVVRLGVAHEKSVASAGIESYGGSRMTNTVVEFGTATDYLLETHTGGRIVVPARFLNAKGNVHQQLFKVGDVIFTESGSQEKRVNIGRKSCAEAVGVRRWHEVCAWIPAEKVDRAIKEGRIIVPEKDELLLAYTASAREAAEKVQKAHEESMAEIERMKAEKAGGAEAEAEDEIGSWY